MSLCRVTTVRGAQGVCAGAGVAGAGDSRKILGRRPVAGGLVGLVSTYLAVAFWRKRDAGKRL